MRKIHHLATCSTCQRILKDIPGLGRFEQQDIKTEPITPQQLDALKEMVGSYEALFSRRSMKFRPMGLHEKQLTEKDYRKLILEEYTFLKRPVIVIDDKVFVGNAKAVVEAAVKAAALT
jgi:arsenate reductase